MEKVIAPARIGEPTVRRVLERPLVLRDQEVVFFLGERVASARWPNSVEIIEVFAVDQTLPARGSVEQFAGYWISGRAKEYLDCTPHTIGAKTEAVPACNRKRDWYRPFARRSGSHLGGLRIVEMVASTHPIHPIVSAKW